MSSEKIQITWVRSAIHRNYKQKRIIEALGFRKLNQTVIHDNSPTIMGMVRKVPHLVRWEPVEG